MSATTKKFSECKIPIRPSLTPPPTQTRDLLPRIHSAAQHTSHIRNPPLPPSLPRYGQVIFWVATCVRPFASVRPWSVDRSVHRFSGPMRRWRGKSQSRVKDVCATLGGGGVDRLQRRQVTIAIGWNGQINRAVARWRRRRRGCIQPQVQLRC